MKRVAQLTQPSAVHLLTLWPILLHIRMVHVRSGWCSNLV